MRSTTPAGSHDADTKCRHRTTSGLRSTLKFAPVDCDSDASGVREAGVDETGNRNVCSPFGRCSLALGRNVDGEVANDAAQGGDLRLESVSLVAEAGVVLFELFHPALVEDLPLKVE